jgi:hypothetical protein
MLVPIEAERNRAVLSSVPVAGNRLWGWTYVDAAAQALTSCSGGTAAVQRVATELMGLHFAHAIKANVAVGLENGGVVQDDGREREIDIAIDTLANAHVTEDARKQVSQWLLVRIRERINALSA